VVTRPAAAPEHAGEETRRSLALTGLGAVELWSGKLDAAAAHLQQAHDLAGRIDLHDVAVDAAAHLALAEVLNGRLTRAADLATEVLDDAGSRGWPPSPSLACAELALAGVCLHREDLAGAGNRLHRAARTARAVGDRPTRLAIALAEVWLSFCCGSQDAAGGLDSLRDAMARLPGGRLPLLAAAARRIEARLLAATGDEAGTLALLHGDGTGNASAEDTTALARLMLARGGCSDRARYRNSPDEGDARSPVWPAGWLTIGAWRARGARARREGVADGGEL
jgi:MalT-like TPR region